MAIILRAVIIIGAMYLFSRFIKKALRGEAKNDGRGKLDPFKVLGVERDATRQDIKEAYHAAMDKYHPDKVSHLGPELQKLAQEKAQAINEAYEKLRG